MLTLTQTQCSALHSDTRLAAPRLPGFAPLSLCMISDDFLPAGTGVGIHLQTITRELARRGHRVSVITTRRKGEAALEEWNGVKVYRTFSLKVFGFHQALPSRSTIRNILLENKVDIVHYHYLSVLMKRTRSITEMLPVKNIYTYHMAAEHLTQPWPMRPFRPLIARQIVDFCNHCDLVMTPSENLLRRMREDGIHAPSAYLSNPIDLHAPAHPEPKDKRKFVVLYAGRLNPEKNLPYLLDAFQRVARATARAELWIAGAGNDRGKLEQRCQSLGMTKQVKFLGQVEHQKLAPLYAAADVFVLPSLVETQGMVALEAMRFSLPVIVTNRIVSAQELVDDGVNGFIVDPDTPDDLSGKLTRLMQNPGLRQAMGQQSLRKSAPFTIAQILDRLEAQYRSLWSRA